MNAYSYDTMKFEVQQHVNRLADEAVGVRLAREAKGEAVERVDGVRWMRRLLHLQGRPVHPAPHPSIARIA